MSISPSDVSVVICAYTEERWNDLVAAVESIQNQMLPPRDIIVVIDYNDNLFARAQQYLSGIVLLQNQEPRGLSGARNSGIASAQGAVIAFMDEDAMAAPDWLECLIVHYKDPQVLGVGGTIEPVWLAGRPVWFPEEFDWVVGSTYRGMPQTTASVRNLIGCNMSFRREVFEAIGGFRDGIGRIGTRPVGCEETELCIRSIQWQPQNMLIYEPQVRVRHRVPQIRGRWAYFRSRCYAEGLSKALVVEFVGSGSGLASERTYTFRTLPRGVLRGLKDMLLHGDVTGFQRAAVIIIGLGYTTAGYLAGKLSAHILTKPTPSLCTSPESSKGHTAI